MKGILRELLFSIEVTITRRLLTGPRAWLALDRLDIPGFGANLVRTYYPIDLPCTSRWGYSRPAHPEIDALLRLGESRFSRELANAAENRNAFLTLLRSNDCEPLVSGEFYSPFDSLLLYRYLARHRPARYIEIGSGTSTKLAYLTKQQQRLDTEIISIDPAPRTQIDELCESVIRARLEDCIPEVLRRIRPGDMLFYDGSHMVLPGNDVTAFFLELLPRLPANVLVHIHDIHLPFDYPADQLRYCWSEQYLLAAYLLAGAPAMELMFPAAYVAQTEPGRHLRAILPHEGCPPSAFWFRTRARVPG